MHANTAFGNSILQPSELEAIYLRLKQLLDPIRQERFQRSDYLGAIGVLLLVFLSMFPVVIPFIFFLDADVALRASNGIAILMLFLTGLSMVILGGILVGLTMALGG